MSEVVDRPTDTVRQVSGIGPDGDYVLSVVAKRTYRVTDEGRCVPAEEQVPLTAEPRDDEENPELLAADTDLHAVKPFTDVVVKGHARARGRRRRFGAAVEVGDIRLDLRVVGDRRCTVGTEGTVVFSEPDPVDEVPLRYDRAYGGVDRAAEERHGDPFTRMLEASDVSEATEPKPRSLFVYPRNPAGKGYLVEATRSAVDGLELPNLEDPSDPLRPDRLAAGEPGMWPRMPLPRATDWVSYAWFPRMAYLGIVPPFAPLEQPPAEVRTGYAPEGIMAMEKPDTRTVQRALCGASCGLQLPQLHGDERVLLESIHPHHSTFTLQLPGERPRLWVDDREGGHRETRPVLHTVVIEPDEDRLTLLWRGAAPARRPYLPEELEEMPLAVQWP